MNTGQNIAERTARATPWLEAGCRLVQMAISPSSRNSAWLPRVRDVVSGLEKLNGGTEADFLAIGGNLMAFLTSSRQLHSSIAGLTLLVSGEQSQHACASLVSVRGFAREMQQLAEDSRNRLVAIQAAAARIHRGFSSLAKIALSFQITAILARIETAHLATDREDLGNLGDEVRSCSDGIQMRVEQVLDGALAFNSSIVSALLEFSRLEAIQEKELPSLLTEVDADLDAFGSQQRGAAGASSLLAASLTSVTLELGSIATSIQFHDITRQQVGHVVEVLTRLSTGAPRGALSLPGASVVRLQVAQLRSAAAAFSQSTRKMDGELDAIAARVAEMADAGKRILGAGNNEGSSFIGDMRRRLAEIHRAVAESSALHSAAGAIAAKLLVFSQTLRASVTEVQTIELQLSRISLNAAVSATHIGSPGEPLSVVAAAMQTLRVECASRSNEAEADLDSINQAIHSLAAGDDDGKGPVSGASLLDDLNARAGDLQSVNASCADAARTVAELAGTLCGNLQLARDHTGIGDLFDQSVNRYCGLLEESAAEARPLWSFHQPAAEESLEERYTMQVQRDIRSAEAGVLVPHSGEAPQAASPDGDVEFF